MTGGICPDCGMGTVCSYHEFREVYDYRNILKRHAPAFQQVKNSEGLVGRAVDKHGPDYELYHVLLEWVNQEPPGKDSSLANAHGPAYICVGCYKPLRYEEFHD